MQVELLRRWQGSPAALPDLLDMVCALLAHKRWGWGRGRGWA